MCFFDTRKVSIQRLFWLFEIFSAGKFVRRGSGWMIDRLTFDMKNLESLPEQIRKIRQGRGLSQENMADQLGVSTSAYGDLERGKTELSLSRLYAIAEILEIEIAELLGLYSGQTAELSILKEANSKLVRMNLELTFKNELLEARLKTLLAQEAERQRIGF